MKKILPALVLLSVLTVLAAPLAVSAQQGPVDCCRMRRNMSWTEGTVGTTICTDASPCTLQRLQTVGPAGATCPMPNLLGTTGAAPDRTTNQWGVVCLLNTVNSVVDWVFMILIALAVIMTLIGAITFITASGSPEKAMAGRNYLIFALVGLIVALLARAIPNIIRAISGF